MSVGTSTGADPLALGTSNAVTFASNGTACILWYDGTNIKMSYASSPYTSWTSSTVSAAGGIVLSSRLDTSDTVNTIFYVSGGLDYAPITLSGTTYSVGSLSSIATESTGGNNLMGCVIDKDPQNRYWALFTDRVGSNIYAYTATSPGGTWTNNHSVAWSSDIENNYPAGGIVGNYLLFLYPTATSTFDYQRLDVHNSSLGSWSAATAFTPGGSSVTYDNYMSFRGNSTAGVEANDSGSGIWARVYNPSTDVWATAVQLSSSASDAKPTVVAGSDGNFYVFWMSFVASNNYAIKYKKYNVGTTTWDSSATTLVSSGANNVNPVGGSTNNQLGILYQTGTSSPYTVNFTSFSFLTNTTYAFEDDLSATDSLLQTDGALPTDALTVSDIGNLQSWPVDALSVSDTAFYTQVAIPIDALTANDSLLQTDGASITDGLTVSDSSVPSGVFVSSDNLTASDSASYVDGTALIDALTVSDNLLKTDSANITDALSISDSTLQTDGALPTNALSITDFGNLQSWPVDALTITDSLLQTDSAQSTDGLSASDTFSQQGAGLFSDNLTASDSILSTDGAQATDSNSILDSATYADVLVSTEPLTISDSELASDYYLPIDALSITSQWVSGPTNNQMAFEDDLSIIDVFLSGESSAFTDSTPCSDSLLNAQTTMPTDALTVTDMASYAELLSTTESLNAGDSSAFSDAYMSIDSLIGSDAIAGGITGLFSDTLTIGDMLFQALSYNQTEPLSILDSYLLNQGISLIDLNSIVDSSVFASGLVNTELLSVSSQFMSVDLAIWLEQNTISDSFSGHSTTTNLMSFTDSLVVSDVFVGTGAFAGVELLTITDTSTMTGSIVPAKVFVQAISRDGYVIARGVNGWVIAQSRDGQVVGKGR